MPLLLAHAACGAIPAEGTQVRGGPHDYACPETRPPIGRGCCQEGPEACPGRLTARCSNDPGRVELLDDLEFESLTLGSYHGCAVAAESGVAHCWGMDISYVLDAPPQPLSSLAAGLYHSCGIQADGQIECWGWAGACALAVPTGAYLAVAATDEASCAIGHGGGVVCWGDRDPSPPRIVLGDFQSISTSCGVRTDGELKCWRDGPGVDVEVPPGLRLVRSSHTLTCALADDGPPACWHRCGEPFDHDLGGDVSSVAVTNYGACALKRDDGSVVCTADALLGEPAPEGPLTSLVGGGARVCGLDPQGRIVCAGVLRPTPHQTAPVFGAYFRGACPDEGGE